MGQIVVVGGPEQAAEAVAALQVLPLGRPPPTRVVVVVGADTTGLVAEAQKGVRLGDRVVVVAVEPLSDANLDLVVAWADEVVEWNDSTVPALEARLQRWHEIDEFLRSPVVRAEAMGRSRAFLDVLGDVVELAVHTELPVLVMGETGTGKEVSARLLHALSGRNDKPFVVVDCTTIVPTLAGSELFGHERGAFTGANSMRTGAVAAADGGTLFLDEIGELPLEIQAELLRVIQEGDYKRVGGDRWYRSRFRLVCATNRDLRAEVAAGQFRQDLYHRIAGAVVVMPPLRDRPEDIVPLFRAFVAQALSDPTPPELSGPVRRLLLARNYPGNLRDLRQLATLVAARHTGPGEITVGDLPKPDRSISVAAEVADGDPVRAEAKPSTSTAPDDALRPLVAELLGQGLKLRAITRLITDVAVDVALERAGSTRSAASLLGVTERTIQLRRAALRASKPEPA